MIGSESKRLKYLKFSRTVVLLCFFLCLVIFIVDLVYGGWEGAKSLSTPVILLGDGAFMLTLSMASQNENGKNKYIIPNRLTFPIKIIALLVLILLGAVLLAAAVDFDHNAIKYGAAIVIVLGAIMIGLLFYSASLNISTEEGSK